MKEAREMRVKYLRRKCLVRGCSNIGCYTLSRRREFGNSVMICADCLADALALARPAEPETQTVAEPEAVKAEEKAVKAEEKSVEEPKKATRRKKVAESDK